MSQNITMRVSNSAYWRNDGFTLRSADGGQTWQKQETTAVYLNGMNFSQIQKVLNKAFKNKEEARFETREAYYGDADFGDGPEEPHIESVVIGWIDATAEEIAKALESGSRTNSSW
jgi:hypothetical protein